MVCIMQALICHHLYFRRCDMSKKRVCVPIHSPVWEYYISQGWVELWIEGTWVTMGHP